MKGEIELLNERRARERNHWIPVTVQLGILSDAVLVTYDRWRGLTIVRGVRLQPDLCCGRMHLQRRLRGQHHARASLDANRLLQRIPGKHAWAGADDDDVRRIVDRKRLADAK